MIRIIAEIDPVTSAVGFDARHTNGQKLTRLEMAYYISKLISALIKDGMEESGKTSAIIRLAGGPQFPTTRNLNG